MTIGRKLMITRKVFTKAASSISDEIREFVVRKPNPVTLNHLYSFGNGSMLPHIKNKDEKLIVGAQFIHQELPIRLAQRVVAIECFPCGLSEMPSVKRVKELYINAFRLMKQCPYPKNMEDEEKLAKTIETIKGSLIHVVPTMANGLQELKQQLGGELAFQVHDHLDSFYMARIGLRVMIGQHLALRQPQPPGRIGIIDTHCSPAEVARAAAANCREICLLNYGVAPEVEIHDPNNIKFRYISSHLHHILFELIKNSMRAVVERYGGINADEDKLPKIQVIVAEGQEDVAIKISDQGGGIPRSGLPLIWTYLYTTAQPPQTPPMGGDVAAPMAGLGFGLPLSRLYARYWGGDLQIISMEGYGTDAYVHLKSKGSEKEDLGFDYSQYLKDDEARTENSDTGL